MGNLVSCQSWHDAKAVIVEADSLLANGVIIEDTAVLAEVIRTLNNPMGRIFAKEELVKAYYLMGRNLDDYHHNFSDAADFYIEADRLKTKDLILRGRINSCMGYLCKQDSCFKEALVFYERANEAFEKSGDERRIANGLVSIAEQYVNMEEYNKADSVLAIAEKYEIDSAYYANVMDVKAFAYCGIIW
jgi:tetratricopeptide (TPR) repeat protein